jgi:hypothetical protein
MNLHAYGLNDPVNSTDPIGLTPQFDIFVTAHRPTMQDYINAAFNRISINEALRFIQALAGSEPGVHPDVQEEIVVTAILIRGIPSPGQCAPHPQASQCVGQPFADFFDMAWIPASKIAFERHSDPTMILGVWALESDWGRSPSSRNRNNIFGATPHGDRTPGSRYGSIGAGADRWNARWGPRINRIDTDVAAFLSALLHDNRNHPPGAVDDHGSYNSETPGWRSSVSDTIDSVRRRLGPFIASGC